MNTLTGKLVRLRPMKDSDYEYFASFKNDLRTQAWNQRIGMCRTAAQTKEYFENQQKKPGVADYSIEKLDGTLVGHIGYNEGPPRFAATMGIIMGTEHWGKGYAQEAHELLFEFLFEQRGIQVIRLWSQSGNKRGIAAAKKMGFKVMARLNEDTIIDGKPAGTVYMDMLREEWYESRKKKDAIGSLK